MFGEMLAWLARLLKFALPLVAAGTAGADTGNAGSPHGSGPARPVPVPAKPAGPSAAPPGAPSTRPSGPSIPAGPATAGGPATQPAGKAAPGPGAKGKGAASKHPARHVEWAVIEGLNLERTWVGQELAVGNGPGGERRIWFLRVTGKTTKASSTTLTLVSFAEDGESGPRPAGNIYTVTHPYQVPPGEKPDEKESAWMLVAEPRGLPLPPEWRKRPGAAIIATVLWQILGPAHRVPPVVPTPP